MIEIGGYLFPNDKLSIHIDYIHWFMDNEWCNDDDHLRLGLTELP